MGTYTEILVRCEIKKDTPLEALGVLQFLFNGAKKPEKLPTHPFFNTPRWEYVGSGNSDYHFPFAFSILKFDEISNSCFLISRSDFKNYDNEIALFFDWLSYFVDAEEGDCIGGRWYEENEKPELWLKGVSK